MSFKKQILEAFSQSQGWQGKCLLSLTPLEKWQEGERAILDKTMLAQ